MRYTIARLHRELGELISQGHGRRIVAIAKDSFQHNCEPDGVTILDVEGLGIKAITNADDDGGTKFNKDGTESITTRLVLAGSAGVNGKGELLF